MDIFPSNDTRIGSRLSVDLLLNKYLNGRPYLCRASNISRNGLLVHRIMEPESDDLVMGLQFQLPDTDRIITCVGRVIYEHEWIPAQGIQITSISPEHQGLLDQYIHGQSTSFAPAPS